MKKTYARASRLYLEFENKDDTTILKDIYNSPPFLVMHTFKYGDFTKAMIMSSSPGILEGDRQEERFYAKKNSKVLLSSQSYEKVYKMSEDSFASRRVEIRGEEKSDFIFKLLPMILYKDADFREEIKVDLEKDARLIFSNSFVAGRVGRGESFEFKSYKTNLDIKLDEKLIYTEKNLIRPREQNINELGLMEGYDHFLSMVAINFSNEDNIGEIRKIIEKHSQKRGLKGGASYSFRNDIQIRILGKMGQDLIECEKEIIDYLIEKGGRICI